MVKKRQKISFRFPCGYNVRNPLVQMLVNVVVVVVCMSH